MRTLFRTLVASMFLTVNLFSAEVVHVSDDFEDGNFVSPNWLLDGDWSIVFDPLDSSNLVAFGRMRTGTGTYLRFDVANIPFAGISVRFDFLITDNTNYQTQLNINPPGGRRFFGGVYAEPKVMWMHTPKVAGSYDQQPGIPGPTLQNSIWYTGSIHYDEILDLLVSQVRLKSTGNVIATYTVIPSEDMSLIPDIVNVTVGLARSDMYIDNIVFSTILPDCNSGPSNDFDADGILNESDNCPCYYNPTQEYNKADLDQDCDVDGNDFLTFSNCFNGSLNPPNCP